MPSIHRSDVKKFSSKLSDSVDLGNVQRRTRLGSPCWLDALQGPSAVTVPKGEVEVFSKEASPPAALREGGGLHGRAYTQSATQDEEPTPATSRYPAESTATGSPLPKCADESDVDIERPVSPWGSSPRNETTSTPKVSNAEGPRPTSAPPPEPARQSAFQSIPLFAGSPPPSPELLSTAPLPMTLPPPSARTASPRPHGSTTGVPAAQQHTPFGDSRVGATSALIATSSGYGGEDTSIRIHETLSRQDLPPTAEPTPYSSALMQALSRTEGSAAMMSQWTSIMHHGDTSAYLEETTGAESSSDPLDMYEEAIQAKVAKQQWVALEKARQELLMEARRRRDCPFAPQLSPYAAQLRRPASLRPENRVQAEVIRRKQWLAKKKQEEVERALQECTFRPLTLRTAHLDPATLVSPRATTTVFENLYREAEDRRTFEEEVKPKVLQELEQWQRPIPKVVSLAQLVDVVDRLCTRGVIRSDGGVAVREGQTAHLVPFESDTASGERAGCAVDTHQPTLSAQSQRIVAAQLAVGEREGDIVQQLYHQADRGALRIQLKQELEMEQQRLARAEQAVASARRRKRLQQEYFRSVLAAKYRILAQRAAESQHSTYRITASQSVVQLARAALDVLSADEAEELLGAVEHCGQHKLTETEFAAVVFQYLSEQRASPATSALLRNAPPPLQPRSRTISRGRGDSGKTAGSALRLMGSRGSLPAELPQVKRERPDPEMVTEIRAKRELELEEWKREHLRQRAIEDGVLVDDECTFQPAPRRLIPYECRPDVTVSVKTTRSEALRRASAAARLNGGALKPTIEASSVHLPLPSSSIAPHATRELFPSKADTATSSHRQRGRSQSSTRVKGAASLDAGEAPPQRERSATRASRTRGFASATSPARRLTPAVPTRSEELRVGNSAFPLMQPSSRCRTPSYTMLLPGSSRDRQRHRSPAKAHAPTTQKQPCEYHGSSPPPAVSAHHCDSDRLGTASLIEQITRSTPQERTKLGRELLLRQLREHQRRFAAQERRL